MKFKDIFKKGCETGYITDTNVREDSFSTVEEAIEAGIITDVNVAQSLLSDNAEPETPVVPETPEIIDGKASTDNAGSAEKALEEGAKELDVTADMKEPVELKVQEEDTKLNFQEGQSEQIIVSEKKK